MGWGPLAWEGAPGRRPRPLGTPGGAVRMLARPPVALAQPARSCEGFGVPAQTQLSPSCVCSGSGRAQGSAPGAAERGSAPQPGHAPLSSLAPPGTRACTGPRSQRGSPSPAAAPAGHVHHLGCPSSPSSEAPWSPPRLRQCQACSGLPGLPGGSRRQSSLGPVSALPPAGSSCPPPTFRPSPGPKAQLRVLGRPRGLAGGLGPGGQGTMARLGQADVGGLSL